MLDRMDISKYKVSMAIVLDLFKRGLITKEEFSAIEKALAKLYGLDKNSIFRIEYILNANK